MVLLVCHCLQFTYGGEFAIRQIPVHASCKQWNTLQRSTTERLRPHDGSKSLPFLTDSVESLESSNRRDIASAPIEKHSSIAVAFFQTVACHSRKVTTDQGLVSSENVRMAGVAKQRQKTLSYKLRLEGQTTNATVSTGVTCGPAFGQFNVCPDFFIGIVPDQS